MRPRPHRRRPLLPLALLAFALPPLALLGACGDDEPAEAPAASVADQVRRARAAALFEEDQLERAREALAPLVARDEPAVVDLLGAANVELAFGATDRARPLVERAAAARPDDAAVQWALYRLAHLDGELEQALVHVSRAHELAPDDYPTHLALANTLSELDRASEAEGHYEELLRRGPQFGGDWYMTTVYRYSRLLLQSGRTEEWQAQQAEYDRLKERGLSVPGPSELDRGTFGRVFAPEPERTRVVAPAPPAPLEPADGLALATGMGSGTAGVAPFAHAAGAAGESASLHVARLAPAPPALLAWGSAGLVLRTRSAEEGWELERLLDLPVDHAAGFVLRASAEAGAESEVPAIAAAAGGRVLLLLRGPGGWEIAPAPLLAQEGRVRDIVALDYDHEGDLDLVLVGDFGARLLRNDGAADPGGGFADVTAEAGLPAGRFARAVSEDLDGDGDVDLLLAPADAGGRAVLLSNERGGRFSVRSDALPDLGPGALPLVADLDGDGRPDLALPGRGAAPTRLFLAERTGGWRAEPPAEGLAEGALASGARVVDWDQDGAWDLLAPASDALAALLLAAGLPERRAAPQLPAPRSEPGEHMLALDLDGDLDLDLLRAEGGGRLGAYTRRGPGSGLLIELRGVKDNARGVGAIVEVRAGGVYQRAYWRGEPVLFGLGGAPAADVVRVTWPNGVVQHALGLAAPGAWLVEQKEGLIGSCPFLYTWDGERFVFVTDVLGITPLGLPTGTGGLVPPDHDEYVLVRGDQLVPRDGVLELQVTEELREVTYLDRLRLDVVDHAAGVEVFPNERFTFPPFPEPHVHALATLLAPVCAREVVQGGAGRDWTAELAAADGALAVPFEARRGQYLGLASPHVLELGFDPAAVRGARRLRLALTGWFYWTDASVNVAAGRHPSIAFLPPILSVPDGAGGWREVGPLGFPAGKLKTMVVDVSDALDPADPRLRIASTLRLYWDAIRLATDEGDAPVRVTPLEPLSARLWERGFSEPIRTHGDLALEWFEWEREATEPRWNMHPGLYTRLGEVVALLGAIDDRFAILGAGDALTVRFDAAGAPPLPAGWERDYVLFLDGWAKDRDPNTEDALYVEPLPFHGMSCYPPAPGESFPDDEAHRAWRLEWNTRPARRWIEPLAPRDADV